MLTHNDSKIKLHKICQILKNCQCKWLLISGRLQDLLQALLRFLRSFFLHGYDCIGCVSKFPEKFLFYLGMIVSVVLPSFVPPQRNDDFLKITILHWELCDPPLLNHHNSWKELEMFRCSGTLSSANPCLNSCNQSSTPCNSSLCNSSSLSFLVGFSISADLRDGFSCANSLVLSLLLDAGISVPVRVSCDEDVEEVSDGEAEDLVDEPKTTNGT